METETDAGLAQELAGVVPASVSEPVQELVQVWVAAP